MNRDIRCGCEDVSPDLGITFAFQPIVDMRRMRVFGYEALVRGTDGSPAQAVLSRLTDGNRHAFDLAARRRAIALAARLFPDDDVIHLSLNTFPDAAECRPRSIVDTLKAARLAGFPYNNLIFELTARERSADAAELRRTFGRYAGLGLGATPKDFGESAPGLGFVAELTPNMVKIDRGLVRGIHLSPAGQAILGNIVGSARRLGIAVAAEGVETREELSYLLGCGIDYFQGYLFAHPGFECLPRVRFETLAINDNVLDAPALRLAS